jgi:hypothetical protein
LTDALLGTIFYPRFPRALFRLDQVSDEWLDEEKLDPSFDLRPMRGAVTILGLR